jgi:hypothetical protein
VAAGLLITLSFFGYLHTLPVTDGDLWLLRTRQPILIAQAVGNIVRGSGIRLVHAFIVLALALTLGWILVAALARAAIIRALLDYFRERNQSPERKIHGRNGPLLGLNFLRAAVTLAAIVGCFAGFTLSGMVSPQDDATPVATLLVAMMVSALVWLAWSMVSWLLSLAAIFAVADGRDTFGAIAAAVDFLRRHSGPVFAVGTWFGLAHGVAFVLASVAAAVPLGLAAVVPWWMTVAGLVAITLVYSAIADFLYIGRLAAYVAVVELPLAPVPSSQSPALRPNLTANVDPDELILSDAPAPG